MNFSSLSLLSTIFLLIFCLSTGIYIFIKTRTIKKNQFVYSTLDHNSSMKLSKSINYGIQKALKDNYTFQTDTTLDNIVKEISIVPLKVSSVNKKDHKKTLNTFVNVFWTSFCLTIFCFFKNSTSKCIPPYIKFTVPTNRNKHKVQNNVRKRNDSIDPHLHPLTYRYKYKEMPSFSVTTNRNKHKVQNNVRKRNDSIDPHLHPLTYRYKYKEMPSFSVTTNLNKHKVQNNVRKRNDRIDPHLYPLTHRYKYKEMPNNS